jgi:hypothetical protein
MAKFETTSPDGENKRDQAARRWRALCVWAEPLMVESFRHIPTIAVFTHGTLNGICIGSQDRQATTICAVSW